MTVTERFLRYISFSTQSDEESCSCPSTPGQLVLADALAAELKELGLADVERDGYGCVYASLPASPGCEDEPAIALLAHMDTAPGTSGEDIRPQRLLYTGGDIVLNAEKGIALRQADFPELAGQIGKHLITTDGTTLLGADDKAGIAEIITAAEYLLAHPEISHGRAALCFTPDEEIGRGADHVDLEKLGAAYGYTVDGGAFGSLEWECFNAADAKAEITGVAIHPGDGKNRMKNAALIAVEMAMLLPAAETPAHTEGREGFFHLCEMRGDESSAVLKWIVRDHDREKFEQRKAQLRRIADYLNGAYGEGTVCLTLRDTYYNMGEMVAPHPEILRRAEDAFRKAGAEPVVVPIRGGTDGARLSFMGLPCPNLSAGGYHFHGVHEYIPEESLEGMAEMLVHLLRVEK